MHMVHLKNSKLFAEAIERFDIYMNITIFTLISSFW